MKILYGEVKLIGAGSFYGNHFIRLTASLSWNCPSKTRGQASGDPPPQRDAIIWAGASGEPGLWKRQDVSLPCALISAIRVKGG